MQYIYGASGHGKIVLATFQSCNVKVHAFIDDQADREFCGLPVLSRDQLPKENADRDKIHSRRRNSWSY